MAVIQLNCKGLCCPMPIIEIARQFKTMQVGDILEVEADDPAFKPDVEAWVETMGHKLVKISGNVIDNVEVVKAILMKMG